MLSKRTLAFPFACTFICSDFQSSFHFPPLSSLPFTSKDISSHMTEYITLLMIPVAYLFQNQYQIEESPPDSRQQQRRGSVVPSRAQSLTEQEMRVNLDVPSFNLPGGRRGSGNHLMVPDDESPYLLLPQTKPSFDQGRPTSPTSAAFLQMHSRVRRHRSLPSPGFTNPVTPSPFAVKNQTRSSSFRRPVSS